MKETAVCILKSGGSRAPTDLEVPLDLPADELIRALGEMFCQGPGSCGPGNGFVRCENPIALLHGSRTLREWGVRDGTIVYLRDAGNEHDEYERDAIQHTAVQ